MDLLCDALQLLLLLLHWLRYAQHNLRVPAAAATEYDLNSAEFVVSTAENLNQKINFDNRCAK